MTTRVDPNSPKNWAAIIVLFGTAIAALTVIPAYAWFHDFSTTAWVSFVVLAILNGMSITGGYHRLWAHRTYEAHWLVRLVFMVFGSMTLQNSILIWASGHRTHHRHVDDPEHDPYSAKRGFWFSHMGWMLKRYESGADNFSNAPDLLKDPLVMFQHKHYYALAWGTNLGIPLLIGFLAGDVWGVLLLSGLLRLVWSHQTTFFINSLAHIWGRRPYTDDNTARDNDLLAIFTYGEGYHNYHHLFQYDYRNGVRWYQLDATKWLIASLSWVGLTKNLKRCPKFAIEKARASMQFKRAQEKLDAQPSTVQVQLEAFKERLSLEYDHFSKALQDWAKLKEAWYEDTKNSFKNGDTMKTYKARFKALERQMKAQRKRLQALVAEVPSPRLAMA
ncbi:fatty acid desaturase [Limnobacter humi]|uniref:Fatty acid desaturase n=1 Tax=Limnobacter humi TaxID=1778671 RepID=A0ABT1WFW5_9BURK|nr:fatty acid desaturase [Limnobacter humi]MCQ8896410.1 fatty acid desaturase [Limnobacter humi]